MPNLVLEMPLYTFRCAWSENTFVIFAKWVKRWRGKNLNLVAYVSKYGLSDFLYSWSVDCPTVKSDEGSWSYICMRIVFFLPYTIPMMLYAVVLVNMMHYCVTLINILGALENLCLHTWQVSELLITYCVYYSFTHAS